MNLLDLSERKKIIREIKADENVQRKIVSYKKWNMQRGNFYQYVLEYLESKLDKETVEEMNIFSNVNLQRRISTTEASIYKHEPTRSFFINENESEDFESIYEEMQIDIMLRKANEAYKYEEQCFLQIVPDFLKRGLETRLLLPHHIDVIPNAKDPRKAAAYIISNFDNTERHRIRRNDGPERDRTGFSQGDIYRDSVNQTIGDWDDPQLEKERYYVWTDELNFVMDGKGNILDKETESEKVEVVDENDENVKSPLSDYMCMPFIDICQESEKDFEFYIVPSSDLYDATLLYNVILTSEFQTVEMQGHAQAYYKGDAEHMPENIRVGADKIIYIPVNPNNQVQAEFGFANPGSDLGGIREFRESFLAAFLSSRGLDVSVVSGKSTVQKATSGIEKLLQMVEKFEASKEDFSLFRNVEKKVFYLTYKWIQVLSGVRENGELVLDSKYQLNLPPMENADCKIEFYKPESIKTEKERIDIANMEIDAGISSSVHAAMDYYNLTEEQAIERVRKAQQYEQGVFEDETQDIQE